MHNNKHVQQKENAEDRQRRYLEGAGAVLNVSSTVIEENQEITVTWDNIVYAGPNDWIGAFAADKNLTLFTSPIKFKFTATGSGLKHRYDAKIKGGGIVTTTTPDTTTTIWLREIYACELSQTD